MTAPSADTLVLETPAGGFNEVSSFPLLFGGLFVTVGLLCLFSAHGGGSRVALVVALPALLLGIAVGRVGLRTARLRHRIELDRARARVARLGAGKPVVAEGALRDLTVLLKRGRAWEVGLLPRWHDLQREFTVLTLECGGQRFRLLDGRTEREKQQLREAIESWQRRVRNDRAKWPG